MHSIHQVTAVVLAGGSSRRMGRDKRLVMVEGSPLIGRVVGALSFAAETLVVVDPSRPLPDALLDGTGVRLVTDLRRGQGPLAGLEAGLSAARHPTVIAVGADMPWLVPDLLRLLMRHLAASPTAELACLRIDGRSEPFPIACRRAPTLTRVGALLDGGELRLRAVLDGPGAAVIEEAIWRITDGDGRSLRDIDTPADLARVG